MKNTEKIIYYLAYSNLKLEKKWEILSILPIDNFFTVHPKERAALLKNFIIDIESSSLEKSINSSLNFAQNEIKKAKKLNVQILTFEDFEYPQNLKEITKPPFILYKKGEFNFSNSQFYFSIVGSRKFSLYGKENALNFSSKLASLGITIVSGFAIGIDRFAHEGALNSGKTVGVLGSGIDIIYPEENRDLYSKILENGCIISEFSIGEKPNKWNFPRRNRVISGISSGVLVVEAQEKSGALITASYALEQNREVFAIPGNINSFNSKGTNKLIKEGAKLVEDINDIFDELTLFSSLKKNKKKEKSSLTLKEMELIECLKNGPLDIDELCYKRNQPTGEILPIITSLEMKGLIFKINSKDYELKIEDSNYE